MEITIEQIKDKQQYHLNEARKWGDMLDRLQQLAKENKRASKHVDAARTRAAGDEKPRSKASVYSKRNREQAKTGTRPIDTVAHVFAAADGRTLTDADLLALSKLDMPRPARVLGLVLSQLAKQKKIKKTRDGYIATARLLKSLAATTNGHEADV